MSQDMNTTHDEAEVKHDPVVFAYSVTDGHPHWLIRCPCGDIHRHGAGREGTRVPHCKDLNKRAALGLDGYVLKYAGQAPDDLLRERYGDNFAKETQAEAKQYQSDMRKRAMREKFRSITVDLTRQAISETPLTVLVQPDC